MATKQKYHIYQSEMHDAKGTFYWVADKWGKSPDPYQHRGPKGKRHCEELLAKLNAERSK